MGCNCRVDLTISTWVVALCPATQIAMAGTGFGICNTIFTSSLSFIIFVIIILFLNLYRMLNVCETSEEELKKKSSRLSGIRRCYVNNKRNEIKFE